MAKLGDVFEIQITGEWGSECTENETGIKVLRTTNFTPEGRVNYDDVVVRSINKSKVEKKRLHYGDIILEKSGGTEKTPVGRVVFCDESIEGSIYLCNNFTQAMRVNQSIAVPRYVFYFMWNLHYSGRTDLLQNKTTGIRNLQVKSYLNVEIPLPPLDEQRKIAAVLDKVSDLIAKRRQQLNKLDEMVKARFVEMFGDCINNSKEWDTYSFDQCFDIVSSKRILKSEWKTAGIPFLRVRDMVQLATTGKMDNEFFVSEEFYASLSDSDGTPQEGDILVSATSTLGKCYIVGKGERFYFKDADVLRFRTKKEINPIFFIEQMKTRYIEEQIDRTLGVTTVSHFTIKAAKTINMRCPNIEFQNQFAAFVQQVEKEKTTISSSLEKLETLKKALMQEHFG